MWYHPLAENPVDRARRAWERAGAAVRTDPEDPAKAAAERRARARYEDALRAAGLTPLLPAGARGIVPDQRETRRSAPPR
jgi:hypothetical protein